MKALTHVTFLGIANAAGAPECVAKSWTRACDWRNVAQASARLNVLGTDDVEAGARPTCPACAVHLDAALEMAGR